MRSFIHLAPVIMTCLTLMSGLAHAVESVYQKPEPQIDALVRAPGFPRMILNMDRTALIKASGEPLPSISYVARPQMKLAGVRFNPDNYTSISNFYYKSLSYFDLKEKRDRPLGFPEASILRGVIWSPKGRHVLVTIEKEKCHEVWIVSIPSLKKQQIPKVCVNAVLGRMIAWLNDNEIIISARTKNQRQGLVILKEAPVGPVIQESKGQVSENRTYADLLKTPQDEKLFAQAIEAEVVVYNLSKKALSRLRGPGMVTAVMPSPDQGLVAIEILQSPFSLVVPYYFFGKKLEVWSREGKAPKMTHSFVREGPQERIPIQGVPTGPRFIHWAANEPRTLMFVSALDQGDWSVKVDFRDELFAMDFRKKRYAPESQFKIKNRLAAMQSIETSKVGEPTDYMVTDYEREKEWITTQIFSRKDGSWKGRPIFSLSENDDYNDPGSPIFVRNQYDNSVIGVDRRGGEFMYFAGRGATPDGERPFLKKMNLATLEAKELFRSKAGTYESLAWFVDDHFGDFVTSYQTQKQSPQYYQNSMPDSAASTPPRRELLISEKSPYELLGQIKKEVITYKRKDGVLLSGILYYPLNYKAGTKYPAIISAYPLEYTDASVAGQVRGSSDTFSTPFREDVIYNALRGYVVLDEAQMPIIGPPETKNDTFIAQLTADAKAAVDALDARGLVDRKRIGVIGHSYGAFMVAHLLTHTDLFATGIAKSGAYNRTLTPFGFQGERRPFWKAKETYLKLSPYLDAEKMKKPMLLMHGLADNNPGTFTLQSERYFEALKGQGAEVRLVLLPEESHGYASMESIEHVLFEIFSWFDLHLR